MDSKKRILWIKKKILILKLMHIKQKQSEKNKKRFWVRKIYTERLQKGEFHLLFHDLRLHDQEFF